MSRGLRTVNFKVTEPIWGASKIFWGQKLPKCYLYRCHSRVHFPPFHYRLQGQKIWLNLLTCTRLWSRLCSDEFDQVASKSRLQVTPFQLLRFCQFKWGKNFIDVAKMLLTSALFSYTKFKNVSRMKLVVRKEFFGKVERFFLVKDHEMFWFAKVKVFYSKSQKLYQSLHFSWSKGLFGPPYIYF